jgi:hypothetical protein
MSVCVNCGTPVDKLYLKFGGGYRLHKCTACGEVADKYVEYESALVVIDLVLLKRAAFRHIMFNVEATRTALLRLAAASVGIDAVMKWVLLHSRAAAEAEAAAARAQAGHLRENVPLSPLQLDAPPSAAAARLLLAAALDAAVFLGTVFGLIRMGVLVQGGPQLLTPLGSERLLVGVLACVTVKAAVLLMVLVVDYSFSLVQIGTLLLLSAHVVAVGSFVNDASRAPFSRSAGIVLLAWLARLLFRSMWTLEGVVDSAPGATAGAAAAEGVSRMVLWH